MVWSERSVNLLGVQVHDVPREEWQAFFGRVLRGEEGRVTVATPNPEFVIDAVRDSSFRVALSRMDIALPDGMGLVYAAAALHGTPLHNRYTGVQAMDDVLALMATLPEQRLVVFGGQHPEEYVKYVASLRRQYPSLEVEYVNPGLIDPREPRLSEVVREELRTLAPTVVLVVLTHKKQVPLMLELVEHLPSLRLTMGIGGAIDMKLHPELAAPEWMKHHGVEWAWRLYQEPWRYKRIFNAVIVFPLFVAGECVRTGRFFVACRKVFELLRLQA